VIMQHGAVSSTSSTSSTVSRLFSPHVTWHAPCITPHHTAPHRTVREKLSMQRFDALRGCVILTHAWCGRMPQVVAATGDELVDLDTVADDSVVLVSPTPSAAVPSSATKSGVGASITAEDGAAGGGGSGAPAGQSSPSSSAGGPTQDATLVGDGGDASVGDRAGDSAGMAGKVARIREMLAARNSGRDRGWQSTTPTGSAAASARLKAHQDRLETADDGEVGRLRRQREKLPAFAARRELVEMINGCPGRVCVVSGSTGCGKTTQVPQFLLEDAIRRGKGGECSIVCTQPRRISAIGVAERVAVERGERCGDTVGYAIRLESRISAETRLSFLTTGLLLRRLISDPTLKGTCCVDVYPMPFSFGGTRGCFSFGSQC
jgi:hypothetical protein